jgi:hypothetical protein
MGVAFLERPANGLGGGDFCKALRIRSDEIRGSQRVAFTRINASTNEGISIELIVQREVHTLLRRGAGA